MRRAAIGLVLLAACSSPPIPQTPSDKAKLATCRKEAVEAFQTAPLETAEASAKAVYEACKKRLGVTL